MLTRETRTLHLSRVIPRAPWAVARSMERRKDGTRTWILLVDDSVNRGPNGRDAATLSRVARSQRAAQNGFLLFRNYRDVGSLGRHGGGGGGRGAAVGRKFKIEYLACNFHRSSKNHAVSYLAGGSASHPPRGEEQNERTNERTGGRGERKAERGKPARGKNGVEREGNDGESSPLFASPSAKL